MGLDAEILAQRWERGTKKEEEKIPHMCESTGHRPLRGRCPKTTTKTKTTTTTTTVIKVLDGQQYMCLADEGSD